MLSRIAESFFWLGRYLERAEATTRLLAEHHQLLVEDTAVPEDVAARLLLDALSVPSAGIGTGTQLVRALVGRAGRPTTVAGAVTAARENARSVRDTLTGDVFEALNGAHFAVQRGAAIAASPGVGLYRILERLMVVDGAVEWTMPRDEGWLFLSLGRALERIDMTSRLIALRQDELWPESGPVATLRSAGAFSPFLRTRHPLTADAVRGFLVLDPDFPRSMLRVSAAAEQAVRGLAALGATDDGEILREVGMLRSRLEFAVAATPEDVVALGDAAAMSAARASDAVAEAFFRQAGTIVWSH